MNEQQPLFAEFPIVSDPPAAPTKRKEKEKRRKNSTYLGEDLAPLRELIQMLDVRVASLEAKFDEFCEKMLATRIEKESYTTQEVAALLGKRPYTVREWCRLKRVRAHKAEYGRGGEDEWRIAHEELVRIQNEGLLPLPERD